MGCSRKAISEDEDDWYEFKVQQEVIHTDWKVYSRESSIAKDLAKRLKLKGKYLIEGVALMIKLDDLVTAQRGKDAEFTEYQRLKKIYG